MEDAELRKAIERTKHAQSSIRNLWAWLSGEATPIATCIQLEGGIQEFVDALLDHASLPFSDYDIYDTPFRERAIGVAEARRVYCAALYCIVTVLAGGRRPRTCEDIATFAEPFNGWKALQDEDVQFVSLDAFANKDLTQGEIEELIETDDGISSAYLHLAYAPGFDKMVAPGQEARYADYYRSGLFDNVMSFFGDATGVETVEGTNFPDWMWYAEGRGRDNSIAVPDVDHPGKALRLPDKRLIPPDVRRKVLPRLRADVWGRLGRDIGYGAGRLASPRYRRAHRDELLGHLFHPDDDPDWWFQPEDERARENALDEVLLADARARGVKSPSLAWTRERYNVLFVGTGMLIDPFRPSDTTVADLEGMVDDFIQTWVGTDADYDQRLAESLDFLSSCHRVVLTSHIGLSFYEPIKYQRIFACAPEQIRRMVDGYLLDRGFAVVSDEDDYLRVSADIETAKRTAWERSRERRKRVAGEGGSRRGGGDH